MSSKWRALQHRHRYTYGSVVFPKHFLEALNLVPSDAYSLDFFYQLKHLISLGSTYSEVEAVKDLASAFIRLLASPGIPEDVVSTATRLYLEILFLENSLPVHRTLISALVKSQKFASGISECLLSICEEYGNLGKKGRKQFLVSRAVLSLMSYPKLGFLNDILERCSSLVAMDVIAGLECVVLDVEHGSRPSPVVMEQSQEAMSCLYYLLQRYPTKFVGSEEASAIFESVVGTILCVLKSSAFSRDCLVAAGVSFCAAIQAYMSPREISFFVSKGLFGLFNDSADVVNGDMNNVLHYGDWHSIIQEFSVLSRLCLLRGILTAIPRTVLNMCLTQSTNGPSWTILYSGILPELCKYCEKPIDSHFNFHALTVTQICLQQIKTSILANLTDFSGDRKPLSEDSLNRILRIIWNNLEDPLSQTVKQVHLIFDLLLDIVSSLPSSEGNDVNEVLLHKVAGYLLHLGPRSKGRYVPLAALTKRFGAKTLLDLNQNLLFETACAYMDDDVCCAATTFLKCFLECLRDECWKNDGIERGYDVYRDLCLPPILHGLVSGHAKLRSNLNTYALPVVLEVDMDGIFPMLAFISVGPNMRESIILDLEIEQCVAALVSLLKVSRTLALIEGDIDLDPDFLTKDSSDHVAVVCIKGINVRVPAIWFNLALKHADDSLRIDAAESLFLNPKTSSLPSAFELSLMRVAVPLNMRCSSTAFQMKWRSLFRKIFTRVRTALERQVKQGFWQPHSLFNGSGTAAHDSIRDIVVSRAEDLFHFMNWLSFFLFHSCYPSAPYERKTMAMELILVMIDVWPIVMPQGTKPLNPYNKAITSPDATLALVGSIIDSWDKLRESSFQILLCFPTPLPGISSIDSVNQLIRWAKTLVCSPRVRESDAGALTFRLVYKKYILGLGWELEISGKADCLSFESKTINGDLAVKPSSPITKFLSSLIEWLCIVVEEGEKDLSEACRKSFVHGVLLTLRYTFEELDWSSPVVQSSISELRCLLEKLLDLIKRITSLALWVVSADAWSMSYGIDDAIDDSAFLTNLSLDVDPSESAYDSGNANLASEHILRPTEQVVMVGCWLAMKEVSLLLGTIIRKIPLPSCTLPDSFENGHALENSNDIGMSTVTDGVLDLAQLETIGNHFLQVLLKMKHNGAIDKTRAGFTALCNRLLCSNDPRLNKMTESWMEQLMVRTTVKGQTVDDLLRRSAGIPAAFIAFFLSEPEGTPKKLLPRALQWLIGVANKSLSNSFEVPFGQTGMPAEEEPLRFEIPDLSSEDLTTLPASTGNFKMRDEGVVPMAHAFNVLRAAFNDTNLAVDTSGFCAEAMIVSIRSVSSPYWEIRNSACLAYSTLVRRMLGFFNIQKRESSRRSLTGLEFFHRYPALHDFLLSELKIATEQIGDGCSKHIKSNIAKAIHPSLCPILILLSRLKPSTISSGIGDALDPSFFMPFIHKCAMQSNLRVRVLASRALTGLVSNEKLQTVICSIAYGLPHSRGQMLMPMAPPLDLSGSSSVCNGFRSVAACAATFNSIHGLLLQLSSLLDNNCRALTDASMKEQILSELIQVLSKCYWIGSIESCPCPTLNSSYMSVLDLMLDISRTYTTSEHTTAIRSLLLELALGCLDVDKSSSWLTWYDPTVVDLRKQAAVSYFSCLLSRNDVLEEHIQVNVSSPLTSSIHKVLETETNVSELQQKIMSCVLDPTYEVRLATLKKVLHLVNSLTPTVKSGVMYMWAKSCLNEMLIKLLSVEGHPKCIYYVLKIFFNWNLLQLEKPTDLECSITTNCDFLFAFWDWLINLYKTVKRTKTREITLCCMGICAKQFISFLKSTFFTDQYQIREEAAIFSSKTNQSEKCVRAFSSIVSFVSLVNDHSAPSEPVSMRRAAAVTIVASGMLAEATTVALVVSNSHVTFEETCNANVEEKISQCQMSEVVNFYGCRILDLWFTSIQLLEDEDNGLRQKLAKDVQNCMSSIVINRSSYTDAVPTQVDRVIGASFDFLSSIFGHWLEYLKYLANWVLRTASSVSSQGDLVQRIFDKEIDNHHEEKLLICQLCCSQLGSLLVPKSGEVQVHPRGLSESCIQKFSSIWRLRFLQQLISFANSCLETEGITDWIGGIGNHKDAFVSLYANLLGIYVLSQQPHGLNLIGRSTDSHEFYLSQFSVLEGIIKPFLRNPLITNLYYLVLQSHKRMLGASRTHCQGDILLDAGFDPYFLLQ